MPVNQRHPCFNTSHFLSKFIFSINIINIINIQLAWGALANGE